ncbi:MAG: hypothetical protein P4N59_21745 [Negativicutes bacterium]|nr:hypothetical protein [Negativicutes bacterium]
MESMTSRVVRFWIAGLLVALLHASLTCIAQDNKNLTKEHKVDLPDLQVDAVIISNAGPQRKHIPLVVLYANEHGWNQRFKKFNPGDLRNVKGEMHAPQLLANILTEAAKEQHWVSGQYGDTEFLFFRNDGKRFAVVMDKGDTTVLIEKMRSVLDRDSIVWYYLMLMNTDFSSAESGAVPTTSGTNRIGTFSPTISTNGANNN